jgi:hypothetical protein
MGGKVHDRVHAAEDGAQLGAIGYVSHDQFKALCEPGVPGAQVVVNNDFIAPARERMRSVTADVTRTSDYQNRQLRLSQKRTGGTNTFTFSGIGAHTFVHTSDSKELPATAGVLEIAEKLMRYW